MVELRSGRVVGRIMVVLGYIQFVCGFLPLMYLVMGLLLSPFIYMDAGGRSVTSEIVTISILCFVVAVIWFVIGVASIQIGWDLVHNSNNARSKTYKRLLLLIAGILGVVVDSYVICAYQDYAAVYFLILPLLISIFILISVWFLSHPPKKESSPETNQT